MGQPLQLTAYIHPVPRVVGAIILLVIGKMLQGYGAPQGSKWIPVVLFTGAGIALLFACVGFTLRRDSEGFKSRRWLGFRLPGLPGVPVLWRSARHEGISAVSYYEFVRITTNSKGQESEHYVYPVEIHGPGSKQTTAIEMNSMLAARRAAKSLARGFGVALRESVEGGSASILPDELRLTMRERLAERGVVLAEPVPPPACRLSPRVADLALVVELPRPPVRQARWILAVLGLAPTIVLALIARLSVGNAEAIVLGLASATLFFVPLLNAFLRRDSVAVSPRGLEVHSRFLGFIPLTRRIPSLELEFVAEISSGTGWAHDKFGPEGAGLRAVSDDRLLEFGWGLTRPERIYLKRLIVYYAAS